VPIQEPFDLARTLATARAALPRGAALLGISDWYDLDDERYDLMTSLAARFDCTALVARDPWFDGLPLRGFVRMRGAEAGHARMWIGARERAAFARAVRERERLVTETLGKLGWRVGILHESDGAAGLLEAFGVPLETGARR
jgi:hypothetical protein